MTLRLTASTRTDIGCVREENQDAVLAHLSDSDALYAIADGMGGYTHGGVASTLALETFYDTFYRTPPGKPADLLRRAVQHAGAAVFQMAARLGARMGTTLTAAYLVENRLYVAHVGDCRVYLLRDGAAALLTRDHTAPGELVALKTLTPDRVRAHPRRSLLTRSLGAQLVVQPDVTQHTLRAGDRLVLCSDGVWSSVQDDEFAAFAPAHAGADALADALLAAALRRDGDDNGSVIVVNVEQVTLSAADAPRRVLGWLGWAGAGTGSD